MQFVGENHLVWLFLAHAFIELDVELDGLKNTAGIGWC